MHMTRIVYTAQISWRRFADNAEGRAQANEALQLQWKAVEALRQQWLADVEARKARAAAGMPLAEDAQQAAINIVVPGMNVVENLFPLWLRTLLLSRGYVFQPGCGAYQKLIAGQPRIKHLRLLWLRKLLDIIVLTTEKKVDSAFVELPPGQREWLFFYWLSSKSWTARLWRRLFVKGWNRADIEHLAFALIRPYSYEE